MSLIVIAFCHCVIQVLYVTLLGCMRHKVQPGDKSCVFRLLAGSAQVSLFLQNKINSSYLAKVWTEMIIMTAVSLCPNGTKMHPFPCQTLTVAYLTRHSSHWCFPIKMKLFHLCRFTMWITLSTCTSDFLINLSYNMTQWHWHSVIHCIIEVLKLLCSMESKNVYVCGSASAKLKLQPSKLFPITIELEKYALCHLFLISLLPQTQSGMKIKFIFWIIPKISVRLSVFGWGEGITVTKVLFRLSRCFRGTLRAK